MPIVNIIVTREGAMDEIALQVECPAEMVTTLQEELHVAFSLRVPVEVVATGTLPRFELKAQRVVRKNNAGSATGP